MTKFGEAASVLMTAALMLFCLAARADINATTDRNRVALGDTLRLTVSADEGEDVGAIDLAPLEQDFEVLGRSLSTNTSIINGRYSSSVDLVLDITPRRQGDLTIPPLHIDGRASNRLQVVVGPPPSGDMDNESVSFKAELDSDSVYVQGQLLLTLRVQEGINLEDRSITELKLDDAFVHMLDQQSFQRTVNGRPRLVHEVRYAIFPEQSGTLTIPVQTYSARERGPRRSVFDMGGGGRQLRRQTEALQVEVLPRPDSYPDADWLPASELTVEENWSTPPEQLRVGESATRTVTIRGAGLQGAQLPPVLYPATRGLKFYPDQPQIQDSEAASGVVGTRVDSVAVVPTEAGTWHIPELRIPWWDTNSNALRYAVLPARELTVAAADPATHQPPPPAPQAAPAVPAGSIAAAPALTVTQDNTRLWQAVSAVTGLGWLLTLVYLVLSRRRRTTRTRPTNAPSQDRQAFKAALEACNKGDAALARRAVISWAAQLPGGSPPPVSLAQVAAMFPDRELETALETLDKTLYSDASSTWNGAALAQCLRRVRSRRAEGDAAAGEAGLQLYPQGA